MSSQQIPTAPRRENTCAIVVTYHPAPEFANTVVVLLQMVAQVIIVDNSTGEGVRKGIPESIRLLVQNQPLLLLENGDNLGIGAGLNRGLYAAEVMTGIEWALLLDQDSVPLPGMIGKFAEVYATLPQPGCIAQISANFVEAAGGPEGYPFRRFGERIWMYSDTSQTSGTLLSLRAWRAAGALREDFFLYWLDVEYGLRLRRLGWRTVLTREPLMVHETGNTRAVHLAGQTVALQEYVPERHYFLVRNHLVLLREYALVNPVWTFRSIGSRIRKLMVVMMLEPNRMAKLRFIVRGILDGALNRLSYNPLLAEQDGSAAPAHRA